MQQKKTSVVAAKIPAMTTRDNGGSPSATTSELSTMHAGQIRGEHCPIDFGSPPRLSLVHAVSGLSEEIPAGQWALSNGLGDPVALGPTVEIVPLTATLQWLLDFGQDEGGGAPTRFATAAEVENYGGTMTGEPGKPSFSRSMELRAILPDVEAADSTYLRLPLGGRTYLAALYEPAKSAYRSVGVGLNLTWANNQEAPHQRRWRLGIETRKHRSLGTNYFAPTLTDLGRVPADEEAEFAKLIDQQMLA